MAGGTGLLCVASTDAAYVAQWGQERFDELYTKKARADALRLPPPLNPSPLPVQPPQPLSTLPFAPSLSPAPLTRRAQLMLSPHRSSPLCLGRHNLLSRKSDPSLH
eukprot:6177181-Pleurochrysis_carterae.AAC.1